MSITTVAHSPSSSDARNRRPSALLRFVGVVAQPSTYRNLAYLLLGLPLGTIWFAAIVSGVSIAASMVVVALLGIPMFVGVWYLTRAFANVERVTANALLGEQLPIAPMHSPSGNVWVRLRSMTRDKDRWRELGYLLLRFPVGIATFSAAVTAISTPFLVAYAPFVARNDAQPFGDWALSSRMEDVASSAWAWFLIPLGVLLLIASFHLMNGMARACGRWATAWLAAPSSR
jgi:hypothetical protein